MQRRRLIIMFFALALGGGFATIVAPSIGFAGLHVKFMQFTAPLLGRDVEIGERASFSANVYVSFSLFIPVKHPHPTSRWDHLLAMYTRTARALGLRDATRFIVSANYEVPAELDPTDELALSRFARSLQLSIRRIIGVELPQAQIDMYAGNEYEYRGIDAAWRLALNASSENDIIVYFHNRGVTRGVECTQLLHHTLEGDIERVRRRFSSHPRLQVCALHPRWDGMAWYNFWTARAGFVARRVKPAYIVPGVEQQLGRWYYEYWLGMTASLDPQTGFPAHNVTRLSKVERAFADPPRALPAGALFSLHHKRHCPIDQDGAVVTYPKHICGSLLVNDRDFQYPPDHCIRLLSSNPKRPPTDE